MKSRKLGFLDFGKSKKRQSAKASKRSTVRLGLIESLEKREMMATDLEASFAPRAFFSTEATKTQTLSVLQSRLDAGGGGGNSGSGASAEYDGTAVTVSEIEPNNSFTTPQLLPFVNNSAIVVNGSSTNADVEFFAFDLKAGDILDVRLQSSFAAIVSRPSLTLYESNRRELIISQWQPAGAAAIPVGSPLTGGGTTAALGDVALHYIVKADGRYVLRVSDISQLSTTPGFPSTTVNYTLNLRRFRPAIESATAGTNQKIFLDFEGGFINRFLFLPPAAFPAGTPDPVRLTPTREFLPAYGLEASQEGLFYDAIVRRVKAKFDALGSNTTNPNFGIEILNSKDHPDVWGLPNVSRVVIGGTSNQFLNVAEPSGLLGIAQSIDPGNFVREETAIVMHDTLLATLPLVPLNSAVPRVELIAELMAVVIVHEAGHFLGGWHQLPVAGRFGIMDAFYVPIITSGAGPDGIFGTSDDRPIQFNDHAFGGPQPFIAGGVNDTINWLGWALSGGKVGGRVEGTIFQDTNLNRTLDTADNRLSQILVYSDANGNGTFDTTEFSTLSNANGSYSLLLTPGTHTIRTVVPTGFRSVAPLSNSIVVNVPASGALTGRDFGFELIQQNVTGRKFNDVNGNGLRDAGEPGVGGVTIYYDLDGDGRLDIGEPRTTTAADGTYVLPTLPAGTYRILEVLDAGWIQTRPGASSNFGYSVTLTGNPVTDSTQVLIGLDFGNQLLADYGDAPQSYGSASAGFVDGLRLGARWDAETASAFSANADGDDLAGLDDEDGVTLPRPLVRGAANNLFTVDKVNTTGQTAYLNVWMDFNRNGIFESTEKINNPETGFLIPDTTGLGPIFARFRYGLQQNVGPTGFTTSGEVEDYLFFISDTASIAVDDFDTVPRNGTKEINVLQNDFRTSATDVLTVVAASVASTAGGAVIRKADGSAVIYSAPAGFIGRDTFQYTVRNSAGQTAIANVTIDVSLFFENPFAVDDSFDLPTNSIDFPLNVLANDIEGQGGALTITSIVQPDKGGSAAIASGGKSLRYTPARDFGGTEFISYTAIDSTGKTTSATVTLHTLGGDRLDDQLQIRLEAVSVDTPSSNTSPTPLSQIEQGKDFKLRVYVDDLRHDNTNPGSGSGVFSAYFDLLYNLQLVSTKTVNNPASRFNFEVNFVNDFTNFTRGNGEIPGLINEFGATSNNLNMQLPNEVLMAEITFTARSPGIVNFLADPADDFPVSDSLLFNVPGSGVPIERIRYLGTQIEVFGDGVTFPVAIDDTARKFGRNSINNEINVLQNDFAGSTGQIRIASVTQGARGVVGIDRKQPNSDEDDVITYTPAPNVTGFDQFTYTIVDARGVQSTATVTVHVADVAGSLLPDSDDIVAFELLVTNLNGVPIDEIPVGQQFQLQAFVKDLRATSPNANRDTRGIFAAYQDILFNQNLVSPVRSTTNSPNLGFTVAFGPLYNRIREGDIRNQFIINEIGAVATFDDPRAFVPGSNPPIGLEANPLGYVDRRIRLFSITMTADRVGRADFFSDPADILPLHEALTFDPAQTITPDKIHFGFDSVNIVSAAGGGVGGEFHNSSRPLDVNNDGFTSPIDALLIINMLNGGQAGVLGGGGGEGESRIYPDTNNDGRLSAMDALFVINHLNSRGTVGGEGEGGSLASPEVCSSGVALAAEGESDSNEFNSASASGLIYGPIAPASYARFADSLFDISDDEEDELESVLDELVSDIDRSWNNSLLG